MTDQEETAAAAEPVAGKPKKKAKAKEAKAKAKDKDKTKGKPKSKAEKSAKPAKAASGFDHVGKVESLRVTSGAGPEGFEFRLRGRHGKRRSFRLDTADAFAMNAMAHLVLAAHASGTRIGVRTGDESEGVLVVRELEAGARRGKGG